jgi:transporter family protein
MDTHTLLLALLALFGWGVGSFVAKIAANRLGNIVVFWDLVGYAAVTIVYALLVFKPAAIAINDPVGVGLALFSGAIGATAGIAFFLLLVQKEASVVVPLTAVYPALTAILAFLFLKESLTWLKALGIVFATLAVYLLSL